MKKTVAPHITSLLSGAGAVLAVIHPGFTIPSSVQGLVASICVLAATAVQLAHFASKSKLQHNIALADHLMTQAVIEAQKPTEA
jgi:hypothetical protein